jgi:DNA polymerase-1
MSQLEARVIACFCQDEAMLEIFLSGKDFHVVNAALMLGKDCGKGTKKDMGAVTLEDREMAKRAVSFGLMYGRCAAALSDDLGIPMIDAERMRNEYFRRVPRLRPWCLAQAEFCRKTGYVMTAFGSRRSLPGIWSDEDGVRSEAERAAANGVVQGSAAQMVLVALARLHNELRRRNLKALPIITVHDSIVVDTPLEEAQEVGEIILSMMQDTSIYPWAIVPFPAELKAYRHWCEGATKITKSLSLQDFMKVNDDIQKGVS